MAFWTEDGSCHAVEFRKGFGEDAPLELDGYVRNSPDLKDERPVSPIVVCAEVTPNLRKEMKTCFGDRGRIIEFVPKVSFNIENEQEQKLT